VGRIDVHKLAEQSRAAKNTAAGGEAQPEKPAAGPKPRAAKTAKPRAGRQKPVQENTGTSEQEGQAERHTGKLERSTRLPLTSYQHRMLKTLGAADDVETTVRVRAMIELYDTNERYRAAVDKLAQQRAAELVRHRWPTRSS
jgi:hypothetical protein